MAAAGELTMVLCVLPPAGRTWQCSTVQCDFNLPERFQLEYAADDGTKKRPIMVSPPYASFQELTGWN
jgi:threonyl-tRNA synthetase